MKRFLLLTMMCILGLFGTLRAQESETYTFTFDEGITEEWTIRDLDGDGNEWEWKGDDSGWTKSICIVSYSNMYYKFGGNNEDFYPDNLILTTYKYEILENTTLLWNVKSIDYVSTYCNDHYAVVLITDDNQIKVVMEETLESSFEMKEKTLDLSDYAGQSVYIGFRHFKCDGSNASGVYIDNVEIVNTIKTDVSEIPDEIVNKPELPNAYFVLESEGVVNYDNYTLQFKVTNTDPAECSLTKVYYL